jgi:ATP adenylyltransferase
MKVSDPGFSSIAEGYDDRQDGCLFCVVRSNELLDENEFCYASKDAHPVTQQHTLIIPKRHVVDYFDLTELEVAAIHQMLIAIRNRIKNDDLTVNGFNIGVNVGKIAGQSIPHVHVHLIPRRQGDVENPQGGVRGVIPGKQKY